MEVTSTKERPVAPPASDSERTLLSVAAQEQKAPEPKRPGDPLAVELRRLDVEIDAQATVLRGPPGGIERRRASRPAVIRPKLPVRQRKTGLLALLRRLWRGPDIALRRPY